MGALKRDITNEDGNLVDHNSLHTSKTWKETKEELGNISSVLENYYRIKFNIMRKSK